MSQRKAVPRGGTKIMALGQKPEAQKVGLRGDLSMGSICRGISDVPLEKVSFQFLLNFYL
jgi:hypothetical protein